MIAGVLGNEGSPDPARALIRAAGSHGRAALRVAWTGACDAYEHDELLVVLDGFLLPPLTGLADVVAAWRRDGPTFAERLRGGFTLLVWDEAAQRGVLVCDQFSLRPCLVYGTPGGTLRFSTHLPSLRRLLPTEPGPEPRVIVPWIVPHFVQGHRTMLAGVERVGAGRLLELDARGWRRRRYWAPAWRGTIDAPAAELADLLRSELRRAIGDRLAGGAPAATILSGGLDSSVVLATAAGLDPRPRLAAYSTVFPEWRAADESERIEATTSFLGVPGARFAVRPQGALRLALEQLRDSGTVPGGPGGLVERPGVAQAAADGARVLLDGQGGDEVFGSSPYLLADRLRRGDVVGAARLVRAVVPNLRRRASLEHAVRFMFGFGLRPALPRGAGAPRARNQAPAWLTPASSDVLADAHEPWPWFRDDGVPRWWAYHSYLLSDHAEGSGLGEHMWERTVPFEGVRSGAPLFDVGLVELVLRFPPEATWTFPGRPLARRAVEGALPESVRMHRRKANISPFYLDLMTGPDSAVIRELLADPAARIRAFADGAWLDRNVGRRPGPADPDWLTWTTVTWRLATAECWLRWLEDPDFPDRMLERRDLPAMAVTRAD